MKESNLILLITCTIYSYSEAATSDNKKLNNKSTIWKCCPMNNVHRLSDDGIVCEDAKIKMPNVSVYNSKMVPTSQNLTKYFIVLDKKLKDSNFTGNMFNFARAGYDHYLMDDGSLYLERANLFDRWTKIKNGAFCYDFESDGEVLTPIFWSLKSGMLQQNEDAEEGQTMTDFTTGVMFTSCFFLFLVLVVYLILEETRNLIGLTIIAYVFCFLNGLLVLAITRCTLSTRFICKVSTYYVYFFLLASFCWMNIISYDIWSMSRSYTQSHTRNSRRKWIQFMRYAAYAFGVPTALTIMLYVLDNVDLHSVPWFVTPGLENAPCFIDGWPRFFYLYIPVLLLIFCNTVFYILTGCSLRRHYKDTSMLKRSGDRGVTRRQRQRLWMFIKLSVVMGVNWVFEVIAAVAPHWSGWHVTDIYNLLVGVAIFIIFVCKKKTIRKLRIKLRCISAYEIQGRQNRNDSYTLSSHEGSLHVSPNAEGQSTSFQTVSL